MRSLIVDEGAGRGVYLKECSGRTLLTQTLFRVWLRPLVVQLLIGGPYAFCFSVGALRLYGVDKACSGFTIFLFFGGA